jgi:cytochrome c5
MQTGFLHLHKATVILFMLLYILKWVALILNNDNMQAFFAKKALRIGEMVISTLFLFTGIYLLFSLPAEQRSILLWIKIGLVLLSIPIAVVGFKRKHKMLATLSVLLIVGAYGLAEMHKKRPAVQQELKTTVSVSGEEVYKLANCAICHGQDGKLMLNGAKDLSKSVLTKTEIEHQILNGKNAMPAYKNSLNPEQVKLLVDYVETFRK